MGAEGREGRFWPSRSFFVCQLVFLKLWATYGALTTSGGEPPRGIRWPPSLQAGHTGRTLPPADPGALLGAKPCGSFVPGLRPWRLHRLCAVALLPRHPPLEQEGTVLGREVE